MSDIDETSSQVDYQEFWLYLSGGGVRAALGALGVIYFFYDGKWIDGDQPSEGGEPSAWDRITRVTSVSGGSVENGAMANIGEDVPAHFWWSYQRFIRQEWRLPRSALTFGSALVLIVLGILGGPLNDGIAAWAARIVSIAVGLALAHLGVRIYGREKIAGFLVRPPVGVRSKPRPQDRSRPQWLHLFSVVDLATGLPAYLVRRRDDDQRQRQVLVLDRFARANQIDLYDSGKISLPSITYDSSAWPAFTVPRKRSLKGILPSSTDEDPADQDTADKDTADKDTADRDTADRDTVDRGAFQLLKVRTPDADPPDYRRDFFFLDGGLASTLGARLDPHIFRQPKVPPTQPNTVTASFVRAITQPPDDPIPPGLPLHRRDGVMGLIKVPDQNAEHDQILRVVVDAGDHSDSDRLGLLGRVPLASAIVTTRRAINASLNSQITLDRALANRDQPHVWYLPTTGAGRHFDVRLRRENGSLDRLRIDFGQEPATTRRQRVAERLRGGQRRAGQASPGTTASDENDEPITLTPEERRALDFLDRLRRHADQVGTFTNLKSHGMTAAASGVANAYVEARGIGPETLPELATLIARMEQAMLQKGRLEQQLIEAKLYPDGAEPSGFRWPELGHVAVDPAAKTFPISHRGLADSPGIEDNSLAAFVRAYHVAGVRAMECDVQRIAGGELVGLHTTFGWYRVRGSWRRRWAPAATLDQLELDLGYRPDRVLTMVETFEDADVFAERVSWNFEAKTSKTMNALMEQMSQLELAPALRPYDGVGTPPTPPIMISGGARRTTIRIARRANPSHLTASSWLEMLRLLRNKGRADHAAVIQLPAVLLRWPVLRGLVKRVARNATRHRIQVQWYVVNSEERAEQIKALHETRPIGIITDQPDLVSAGP